MCIGIQIRAFAACLYLIHMNLSGSMWVSTHPVKHVCMYICIYVSLCKCVHIYIHIHTDCMCCEFACVHIEREGGRERERERDTCVKSFLALEQGQMALCNNCLSGAFRFHGF